MSNGPGSIVNGEALHVESTPYELPDEQSIVQRNYVGPAEISRDGGQTWEPYSIPNESGEADSHSYKLIECRRDGTGFGSSGISPGGVSYVQSAVTAPKVKWRKRIGETISLKKGRK